MAPSKDRKKNQHHSSHGKKVSAPPSELMCKIPNPLPVRQEATTEDHKRYASEKEDRQAQIRAAQRLNVITIIGVAGGIISLFFVWLSFQQGRKALIVDQRAWLQYVKKPDVPGGPTRSIQLTSGQPINYNFSFKNTGKTPAKNLQAVVFIDVLPATQGPKLSDVDNPSKNPIHAELFVGVVAANEPGEQVIWRSDSATHIPIPATPAEVKMLADGTGYFVVYGIMKYDDIFGVHHWTKFCDWSAGNGVFQTLACTEYNDQDSNQ